MDYADTDLPDWLPLTAINRVRFYKRDEITTDLICCEVIARDEAWTFHEEQSSWGAVINHLQKLPGFHADWFAAVSQPAFAPSEVVAFERS